MEFVRENGEKLTLGYDFSVECEYYDIFGEDVKISSKPKRAELMRIVWASVKAFNPDVKGGFKDFAASVKVKEFTELAGIVLAMLNQFYYVPDADVSEADASVTGAEEGGEKNA